jgi:hypothetical protein
VAPTASPTATAPASPDVSRAPITTPIPGSSLDVTQSDAGVAGRLAIPDDTRDDRIGTADHTGTSEILGRTSDGSDCSYSFDGDTFTAVAWYDAAPDGMLHQMAVSIPSDEMPANAGEQRSGISNGRVYADFASESGFGTTYSGDATEENNGGSSTIAAVLNADTLTFTFTGTTWDGVDFSGQMICTGVGS